MTFMTKFKNILQKQFIPVAVALAILQFTAACRTPVPSTLKIIGGTPVDSRDPLAKRVAVLVDEQGSVVCTVAPVASDVFVTAAHCVFGKELQGWTIRTGNSILSAGAKESPHSDIDRSEHDEILNVERNIMAHEHYSRALLEVLDPSSAPNDIALVKTVEPSAGTIPVPILISTSRWRVEPDLPIAIAGYGRASANDPESSGMLQKAQLKISKVSKQVTEFTAVDTAGKMGCHGDSGGPAFFIAGHQVWLVGIVSRGDRSCVKGTTVFTDLTEFWPFLDEAQRALNFRLMLPNN